MGVRCLLRSFLLSWSRVLLLGLLLTLLFGGEACRGRKKKKRAAGAAFQSTAKTNVNSIAPRPELIPKRHLTKAEIKQVISEARKYTGTPYRFGGASRAGIDCSGLVMASYAGIRKAIPRPSYQQAMCGVDVPKDKAQPGDLVIFHDPPGIISHVGMVTEILPDKTIKFIQSSTSLGVHETKLTEKYWAKRFNKIHRPLVEDRSE